MASAAEELIGTWKLESADDFDPRTGQWVPYVFGNPPCGYFMYDAAGHQPVAV